jgi:hypothetical protein
MPLGEINIESGNFDIQSAMSDVIQLFRDLQQTVGEGLRRDHPDWNEATLSSYEKRFAELIQCFLDYESTDSSAASLGLFDS